MYEFIRTHFSQAESRGRVVEMELLSIIGTQAGRLVQYAQERISNKNDIFRFQEAVP